MPREPSKRQDARLLRVLDFDGCASFGNNSAVAHWWLVWSTPFFSMLALIVLNILGAPFRGDQLIVRCAAGGARPLARGDEIDSDASVRPGH